MRTSMFDPILEKTPIEKLRRYTYVDTLTEAYTRNMWYEMAEEYAKKDLYIAVIGLDNTAAVNRQYGWNIGNRKIIQAADHLKKLGALYYFGADIFVLVTIEPVEISGLEACHGMAHHKPGDSMCKVLALADAEMHNQKNRLKNSERERKINIESPN